VNRDPGASPERTRLAWRRTALSATVVALLAVRPALTADPGPAELTLAAAAMACWVALIRLAYLRVRGLSAGPPRPGRRTVTACAGLTVVLAVLAGVVVTL
jgi:uncharacterized membrane protein YidH (DUF202 family)